MGTGTYQCFCALYRDNATFAGEIGETDMCKEYRYSLFGGYLITEGISFLITIVNMIIRTLNIFLIMKVGYHLYSEETAIVTHTIFVATFINTGFVLLLGNANLNYTALWWFPGFNGEYTDMTENWYLDIGPALISTMLFNSVYVYIDFGMGIGMKILFRCLDKGGICCCKKRKTKLTTIQGYIQLYSGPEHSMNYKYALILSTIFITFMFGLAMPLLFPIAAFTFFNLLLMERILLTYFHPLPRMYDDKLNK